MLLTSNFTRGAILGSDELRKLDRLFGRASLDHEVRSRLLEKRDPALLNEYGLSQETLSWLQSIQADSLLELSQAIASHT